jgi:replicative DNA helicase
MSRRNVEAEQAVLGGIMLAPDAYWRVSGLLTADDFSLPAHKQIWQAIRECLQPTPGSDPTPIDPVTLGEWFEARGKSSVVQGGAYLIELFTQTPSAANIVAYAEIVAKRAEAERVQAAGRRIAACDNFADAQTLLAEVRPQQMARVKSVKDGLTEMVEALQRRYDATGDLSGLPTGVASLDALTSGWQPGNLVIVAARPGMGKTAYALQAAMAAGRCLYFSLEMTAGELMERAVANLGELPHRWLRFPKDAPDNALSYITEASRTVSKLPLQIDDTASRNVDVICSITRQAHMVEPLKLIVIDHLGLIAREGKHDPSELGAITSALKRLAKETDATVMLLCQLNRGLESRTDKRPMLSDLRDSGRIEEDADVVMALYRDEYYTPNGPLTGYLEMIIRKNRSGEQGTAWAKALLSQMRLESCDEPERSVGAVASNDGRGGFASRFAKSGQQGAVSRVGRDD